MAERISLEIPATVDALSTLRMVVGAPGVRLECSLDDLEDLYLATGELLRTALAATDDTPDRLSVEVEVEEGLLRFAAGAFRSTHLRSQITVHEEPCVDLCMVLNSTVDEVSLEDGDGSYRVVLVKRRGSAA
jgi:hypothetical protein